jgi:hypothetical protein
MPTRPGTRKPSIAYKLERLRGHVVTSRRLLGDLRALRQMLQGEDAATLAVP